jgi:hypothetical protein
MSEQDPPESVRPAPTAEDLKALAEAASSLDVAEILDLCVAFSKDPVRLLVYLDVLNRKGGLMSQAAACLVCFDLARRGDARFESAFLGLVPVMAELSGSEGKSAAIEGLLAESSYLLELWRDLEVRLRTSDQRVEIDLDADGDVVELSLFDAEDISDLELDGLDAISTNDETQRQMWLAALERLYPMTVALGGSTATTRGGLFADTRADMARLKLARGSAISLSEGVPEAAAMLPVLDLFLAAHTRAKNLFGRRNRQREASLEAGLAGLTALPEPPQSAAAWLVPPSSGPHAWEKVGEILLDYLSYLGERLEAGDRETSAEALAKDYATSARPQPPPAVLSDGSARRRR